MVNRACPGGKGNAENMPKQNQKPEEEKKKKTQEKQPEITEEKQEEKDPVVTALEEKVTALQAELDKKEDLFKRTAAEYDNYRKRTAREMSAISADVRVEIIRELLPVADNIERSLSVQNGSAEDIRKGVEMVQNQIRAVFEKLGIEAIDQSGVAFDPTVHNAVLHIEDEAMDENVVAEMLQKGYRLGEKILRPAMVKVAN